MAFTLQNKTSEWSSYVKYIIKCTHKLKKLIIKKTEGGVLTYFHYSISQIGNGYFLLYLASSSDLKDLVKFEISSNLRTSSLRSRSRLALKCIVSSEFGFGLVWLCEIQYSNTDTMSTNEVTVPQFNFIFG